MTYARWTGSAWTPLTVFRRWTGSAWQALTFAKRWSGSAWITFGFLQATLSPTIANGSSATPGSILSSSCTTTAINGSGTYTYSWIITPVSGPTVSATSPTAASSTFFATCNHTNPTATATAVCQVTDTVTGTVVNTSNNCAITISYTGL